MRRLREKVETEKPPPELYDPRRVAYEREMMDEGILKTEISDKVKNQMRVEREHRLKYLKVWEKSHAAKLSGIRKYDLSEAREKANQKSSVMLFKQGPWQLLRKPKEVIVSGEENVQHKQDLQTPPHNLFEL